MTKTSGEATAGGRYLHRIKSPLAEGTRLARRGISSFLPASPIMELALGLTLIDMTNEKTMKYRLESYVGYLSLANQGHR